MLIIRQFVGVKDIHTHTLALVIINRKLKVLIPDWVTARGAFGCFSYCPDLEEKIIWTILVMLDRQ